MRTTWRGIGAAAAMACSVTASADVVIDWNNMLIEAIRQTGGPPCPIARAGAMVHAAIYDAVNSIDQSHEPYHMFKPMPPDTSREAAVVMAAHHTLSAMYGSSAALQAMFDAQRDEHLAAIPDGPSKRGGMALGLACASGMLALRADDGAEDEIVYIPGSRPGDWRPTPPDFSLPASPHWPLTAPWTMATAGQFRPAGPAGYTSMRLLLRSAEYTEAYNDVKRLGALQEGGDDSDDDSGSGDDDGSGDSHDDGSGSDDDSGDMAGPGGGSDDDSSDDHSGGSDDDSHGGRTAEQSLIARFWANDRDGTYKPPGQLNTITQVIAQQMGNSLSENARLFALVNLAMADAGVVAWDAKYSTRIDLWRPVTAIRLGGTDGNPDTQPDPNWTPYSHDPAVNGFTPPFPAWVSGHATFAAAHAAVVREYYGTDAISFTVGSDDTPGVYRTYHSLEAAARENGRSRIYLGVHWQFDADDAYVAGNALGEYVAANFLLPVVTKE